MKLNRRPAQRRSSRSGERGVAVVTVLILTAILLLLVASNIRSLDHLQKELRVIERRQLKDLHTTAGRPAGVPPARSP